MTDAPRTAPSFDFQPGKEGLNQRVEIMAHFNPQPLVRRHISEHQTDGIYLQTTARPSQSNGKPCDVYTTRSDLFFLELVSVTDSTAVPTNGRHIVQPNHELAKMTAEFKSVANPNKPNEPTTFLNIEIADASSKHENALFMFETAEILEALCTQLQIDHVRIKRASDPERKALVSERGYRLEQQDRDWLADLTLDNRMGSNLEESVLIAIEQYNAVNPKGSAIRPEDRQRIMLAVGNQVAATLNGYVESRLGGKKNAFTHKDQLPFRGDQHSGVVFQPSTFPRRQIAQYLREFEFEAPGILAYDIPVNPGTQGAPSVRVDVGIELQSASNLGLRGPDQRMLALVSPDVTEPNSNTTFQDQPHRVDSSTIAESNSFAHSIEPVVRDRPGIKWAIYGAMGIRVGAYVAHGLGVPLVGGIQAGADVMAPYLDVGIFVAGPIYLGTTHFARSVLGLDKDTEDHHSSRRDRRRDQYRGPDVPGDYTADSDGDGVNNLYDSHPTDASYGGAES